MSTEILTLSPEFGLEELVKFRTLITEFEDGKEQRRSKWAYPLREYRLNLKWYSKTNMDIIWDFYIARRGAYDTFWVLVPTEYKVTLEGIGDGDGATKAFQLDEFPVNTIAGKFQLYAGVAGDEEKDGSLANSIATEIATATYDVAPNNNDVLKATYQFYFQVRFADDNMTRGLMAYQLLHAGLKLVEVRWPVQYHPRRGNA